MTATVVFLSGMVTDLVASITLPIHAGQHQDARPMQFEAGAAANVMIVAARLGLRVRVVGALGDDPPGRFLRDVLEAEGADTSAIQIVPGAHSPLTLALIDHGVAQHVFIGHVGEGTPIAFTPAHAEMIRAADVLYWHGYVLHERQVEAVVAPALATAREAGCPVYFDVGPTVRSIPAERVAWALRHSTILRMTEDEFPLATGGVLGEAGLAYLFGLGAHMIILSRGAGGAEVITPRARQVLPGVVVRVVDTVGAGDSFNAGFLCGMLRWPGAGPAAWCRLGNAAGAAAVQKPGAGRNLPTCAEITALLGDSFRQDYPHLELSC
jgi:ribokinase